MKDPVEEVVKIQKKVLEARGFIGRNAGWLFYVPDGVPEGVGRKLSEHLIWVDDPNLDNLKECAKVEALLRASNKEYMKFRVVEW